MEITNIYNLIILDESGSMESIKAAALAGCNETLQSIRKRQEKHKEEQKHFITMVTFNSENSAKVVIDTMPIAVVNDFPKEMYNPDSCTPLYDAMGLSFEYLKHSLNGEEKNCVFATIITDGEENSSTIYSACAISEYVDGLKAQGWTFAYMGANHDVTKVTRSLNIDNAMSFEANEHSYKDAICCMNQAYDMEVDNISKGRSKAKSVKNLFKKKS